MSMDDIFKSALAEMRAEIIKAAVKQLTHVSNDPGVREMFASEIRRLLREDSEINAAIKARLLKAIGPLDVDQLTSALERVWTTARRGTGAAFEHAVADLCKLLGVAPKTPF